MALPTAMFPLSLGLGTAQEFCQMNTKILERYPINSGDTR